MAKTKGVYKRGNVYWIRYAGSNGKTLYESSKSGKKKDAEHLFIQRKKEVMDGKDITLVKRIEKYFLKELTNDYLLWTQKQKAYIRKRGITLQLLDYFGNIQLRDFNTKNVEVYQTKILAEGKAHATVNKHLAVLKHMLKKAVEWEMLDEATLKKVTRIKLLPENNSRFRCLSIEECEKLIQCSVSHLKPIIVTALNTGLRREEILSLEWERHIDLQHGFILLDITKNGERREVPINQTLRETFQNITRRVGSPYVFTNRDGKRFHDIKRSFATACRKSKIKNFRFHDIRHVFASHLVMAGVDITTVKELLGHKSLTMTLRYANLSPSHIVNAVDILDSILQKKT